MVERNTIDLNLLNMRRMRVGVTCMIRNPTGDGFRPPVVEPSSGPRSIQCRKLNDRTSRRKRLRSD